MKNSVTSLVVLFFSFVFSVVYLCFPLQTTSAQSLTSASTNNSSVQLAPDEQKILEASKKDVVVKFQKDLNWLSFKNINLFKKNTIILYCLGTIVLSASTYIVCTIIHGHFCEQSAK